MKATINGISLEGTPEEIFAYQKLIEPKVNVDYFNKFKGLDKETDINKIIKQIEDKLNKKPIIYGYY